MSGEAPFVLAGRGACVAGTTRAGIDVVELRGVARCGPIRISGSTQGRTEVTREAVTRRYDVDGTPVTETVIVSPDSAAVLIEWRTASAIRLRVEMHVLEPVIVESATLHTRTGSLTAVLHDVQTAWSVEHGDVIRCTLVCDVAPDAPLQMIIAPTGSGPPKPHAVARARAAAIDELSQDLPSLEAPADAADSFAWAKLGLDAAFMSGVPHLAAGHPQGSDASRASVEESAWCGIAAAALGRYQDARRAARFIAETGSPDDPASLALELLVLARVASVEGDAAIVADAWPRAHTVMERLVACDAESARVNRDVAALCIAALRDAVPLAEMAGDPRAAEQCAARAKHSAHAFARRSFDHVADELVSHDLVPIVLGVADRTHGRSRLDRIIASRSAAALITHPSGDGFSCLDTGLAAWAAFLTGHHAAPALLDALLAQPRRGVIGAWSDIIDAAGRPAGRWPVHAASAAVVQLAVLNGLLGFAPDSARQRVVLRPRLVPAWPGFVARGLRVGEARIRIACRTEGNVQRIEVEQTEGATPLRLVLEPEIRTRLGSARINGDAVTLDPRFDGVWTVPVQLDLDGTRVLELETVSG